MYGAAYTHTNKTARLTMSTAQHSNTSDGSKRTHTPVTLRASIEGNEAGAAGDEKPNTPGPAATPPGAAAAAAAGEEERRDAMDSTESSFLSEPAHASQTENSQATQHNATQ